METVPEPAAANGSHEFQKPDGNTAEPQTPAEVLRAAVEKLRAGDTLHRDLVAELLGDIADDMADEKAVERTNSFGAQVVGYAAGNGYVTTVFPWTSALALARAVLAESSAR